MKVKFPILILSCLVFFSVAGFKKHSPGVTIKSASRASTDTIVKLETDSLVLTDKDAHVSGPAIGYLWSQVSGPAEASFVNEGSSTVLVKKLVAGKYHFQLMVIDDKGSTTIHPVFVDLKATRTAVLNLSPSNNPNEFGLGLLGSRNYSNATSIEEPLCTWSVGGVPVSMKSLLKFDLSRIPQSAIILSADLYLYSDMRPQNGDLVHANSGANNAVLVQQVASDWDPSTLTWFNQPAALTANQVIIPSTDKPFLDVDINVSGLISMMVSDRANYGFKLSLLNSRFYTSRIFCSSYYADASKHPRLVVVYLKK